MTERPFVKNYLLMTLDPLHVGTGSDQMGDVDLPIVREPGTNVPKVPGTSLSGSLRAYAARATDQPACAGKGGNAGETHCGACKVCYAFGYVKGKSGGYAGTVTIFDAHVLFFPVYSAAGPVWVTTSERLEDAGFAFQSGVQNDKARTSLGGSLQRLNAGSRLFEVVTDLAPAWRDGVPPREWTAIANRLLLLDEPSFSVVVNANLEVRTSVSIDPLTGAADEGALFSFEALPRSTWLSVDVGVDDYRRRPGSNGPFDDRREPATPLDLILEAFRFAEVLGVGGMGTRGFGRIRCFAQHAYDRSEPHVAIA